MREIEFRAWYKGTIKDTYDEGLLTSQMIYNVHTLYSGRIKGKYHGVLSYYESFGGLIDDENFVIMQYTGLKDSIGKEIYEGDILEDFISNKRYEVVWDEGGMFLFGEMNGKNEAIDYYEFEENASSSATIVVGNIYENPELVTA